MFDKYINTSGGKDEVQSVKLIQLLGKGVNLIPFQKIIYALGKLIIIASLCCRFNSLNKGTRPQGYALWEGYVINACM